MDGFPSYAPFSFRFGLFWFRPPSRLSGRQVSLESQLARICSYSELTPICHARPAALRASDRLRFNRFVTVVGLSLALRPRLQRLRHIYLHDRRSRLLSTMLRKNDRYCALPSSSFSGSLPRPPRLGHVNRGRPNSGFGFAVPCLRGSNPAIHGAFAIVRRRRGFSPLSRFSALHVF